MKQMKMFALVLCLLVFVFQTAQALPHLTCDKYVPGPCSPPGSTGCNAQGQEIMPTSFVLIFDYTTHADITILPRIDALSKVDIWWEIDIAEGVYTLRAKACIAPDKCSDPSNPVTFTKKIPVLPILKLVQQGTNTYLSSDPYVPGSGVGIPDDFQIKKDGAQTAITSIAKVDPTGKIILWYDITTLSSGSHSFVVAARNMWGASPETVAFPYVKESPDKPTIKIQK